jgi:hypothetical protein
MGTWLPACPWQGSAHHTPQHLLLSWLLQGGERVVLLVNNLGASTPLEMSCIAREAIAYLQGSLQVGAGGRGPGLGHWLCPRSLPTL